MTATYSADIFTTVDGFGAPKPGTWGGYWDKQSAELLDHRLALYEEEQRMVFGANTYQLFPRSKNPSTGHTRRSRRAMPSTSSLGSRRSPRCRCARTAACR